MIMKILFVFVFFIEMLILATFLNNITERKKSLLFTILIGTIIFEIGAIINNYFISTVWLNVSFSFTVSFCFSLLCFQIKPLRAVFFSLLLVAISTIIELITIFVISSLTNLYITNYESQTILLVVEIVISKILYFIITMLLLRFYKKDDIRIKIPAIFFIFPTITSFTVICFWYISLNQQIEYKNQIILAIISALLFLSTVFVFFAFQANAQKENKIFMLQQEQEKVKIDLSYYDILEKQNTNLRLYAHDARNHLSAIMSLNTDPKIGTYVFKMIENLEEYSKVSHSGNRILDVIIDKYVTECNINNIEFFFDVKNNNLTGLEYHDIVSILGNLLDNAIEAALKSEEKSITFETDYRNNYSVIVISNSCDIPPIFNNSKTPITTKSNKSLHGFGLQSVKKTIKKYDGDISIEYDRGQKIFIATIMLDL